MNKLLKLFPLMPAPQQTDKLIWAIVFYVLVPPIAAMILGFILGLTIILLPLSVIVGLAASAYTIAGIVFAILCYTGHDFNK